MHNDIEKVLLSEKEIQEICCNLGSRITDDYKDKSLILIGLLKGCNPFLSDLSKRINLPLEIYYMKASSYKGRESSGNVKIDLDIDIDIKDKDVLLVEDIVDTGSTLTKVISLLKMRKASSIKVVSLLDKPEGRLVPFEADYVGKTIPKVFVVGYGLDFNERYRNLPYIGILKKAIYI
ncbi:hypoxanthine phosphoribosyltransferase [Acholeplasma sp. OttesenSCG-928-E16]|nr:hypoxanthine phosphoribosyltransferase [Acholeplasma sp. OttesenSCG-928-E16]